MNRHINLVLIVLLAGQTLLIYILLHVVNTSRFNSQPAFLHNHTAGHNKSLLFGHSQKTTHGSTHSGLYFDSSSWRPNNVTINKILSYLNLIKSQVPSHLPLTLHAPYLLANESLCATVDGSSIDVLFFVHTALQNFGRREQMRKTFMAEKFYRPFKIRAVFLLGRGNSSQQEALQQEQNQFGDLVQGDFLDSYHNLTHKGVMGFRWVAEHCSQVRLVVKVDDDVSFDTSKLLYRYWSHIVSKNRSIFCNVWANSNILRKGKWEVEDGLFRNVPKYPFYYCSGLAVIMTGDLIPSFYMAAKFTPFFWIDDIYLFGILPAVASNITYYNTGYIHGIMSRDWRKSIKCIKNQKHNCPLLVTEAAGENSTALWMESQKLHSEQIWYKPAKHVKD